MAKMASRIFLKGQDQSERVESYLLVGGDLKVKFRTSKEFYTYKSGNFEIYEFEELSKEGGRVLEYLRAAAQSVKDQEEFSNLAGQYARVDANKKPQSALFAYLDKNCAPKRHAKCPPLLSPFGSNLSQQKALAAALTNQISVIQGPPGTGKTQTILNITANLLYQNKKVAIVSNNNAATQNVLQKLQEAGLGGVCAMLGRRSNKQEFLQNQRQNLASLKELAASLEAKFADKAALGEFFKQGEEQLGRLNEELKQLFETQNEVAKLKEQLAALKCEFRHFLQEVKQPKERLRSPRVTPKRLLFLKNKIQESGGVAWWFKIWLVLFERVGSFAIFKQNLSEVTTAFERLFYEEETKRLNAQLAKQNVLLKQLESKNLLHELKQLSATLLKTKLAAKYANFELSEFSEESLFREAERFCAQFGVVFSTTHSITTSLNSNLTFDYLICDEASQVDLVTGALAMFMAKNVVIVGDSKQLPNVTPAAAREKLARLNNAFKPPHEFDAARHSLLSSVCERFSASPQTLLREHYRCHPHIINFCNQKFYNNELLVLTPQKASQEGEEAVKICFTASGNHARDRVNQREIDEVVCELLPELRGCVKERQIGVITPFNNQKEALFQTLKNSEIEIDTVHKFQGREKEAIIISVVENQPSEFVEDPRILNVAITRAKRYLRLVLSQNFEKASGNLNDFVRYAKYNHFTASEGGVTSVFDLLYKQNFQAREEFLKGAKRVSEFESENIAYKMLCQLLENGGYSGIGVACHLPLLRVINSDLVGLNSAQTAYATHPCTHIDFVLYDKLDKTPLLAIEVDGSSFHKKGSKQHERDELKDAILAAKNFPLLRLKTTQSGEEARVLAALKQRLSQIRF